MALEPDDSSGDDFVDAQSKAAGSVSARGSTSGELSGSTPPPAAHTPLSNLKDDRSGSARRVQHTPERAASNSGGTAPRSPAMAPAQPALDVDAAMRELEQEEAGADQQQLSSPFSASRDMLHDRLHGRAGGQSFSKRHSAGGGGSAASAAVASAAPVDPLADPLALDEETTEAAPEISELATGVQGGHEAAPRTDSQAGADSSARPPSMQTEQSAEPLLGGAPARPSEDDVSGSQRLADGELAVGAVSRSMEELGVTATAPDSAEQHAARGPRGNESSSNSGDGDHRTAPGGASGALFGGLETEDPADTDAPQAAVAAQASSAAATAAQAAGGDAARAPNGEKAREVRRVSTALPSTALPSMDLPVSTSVRTSWKLPIHRFVSIFQLQTPIAYVNALRARYGRCVMLCLGVCVHALLF